MIPWEELDRARVPGDGGEVTLLKRGVEFSIRTAGRELMNSRRHASEDALAELTCGRMTQKSGIKILIGGLGMGYTLAAALAQSEPDTKITLCELIPALVRWNREELGHLAGTPLDDPRISVRVEDVCDVIGKSRAYWDAIVLDVDNGPDGLTRKSNDRLYSISGLQRAFCALSSGGILSVWSSGRDDVFTSRLKQAGFKTETVMVRACKSRKGSRHTIWLAEKP